MVEGEVGGEVGVTYLCSKMVHMFAVILFAFKHMVYVPSLRLFAIPFVGSKPSTTFHFEHHPEDVRVDIPIVVAM
jgi:hypothetical protein